MALWTSDLKKMECADKYFASINPMAARIIETKRRVVRSFSQGAWTKLKVSEKEEAINRSIISTEARMRYKSLSPVGIPDHCKSVFPALIIETGQETVKQMEDKEDWQDEHSMPFSWETKSQMNLTLPIQEHHKPAGDPSKPQSIMDLPKKNLSETQVDESDTKEKQKNVAILPQTDLPKIDSSNKPSETVVTRQPLRHIDSPPDENTNATESILSEQKYGLITGERKKKSVPLKAKLPSRINPRASLTLDDVQETIQTGHKDEGAIRNLEVALKEEEARKNKTLPQEPKKTDPFQTFESSSSVSSKSETEVVEDVPLLKIELDVNDDNSLRKSGFDFLDNW